jgi:hypothetical protein
VVFEPCAARVRGLDNWSRSVSDSGAEGSYVTIHHVIPGRVRVCEDHA